MSSSRPEMSRAQQDTLPIEGQGATPALVPGLKRGLLIATLALVGCAVGPDFRRPVAPNDVHYTERDLSDATANSPGLGGAAQHFSPDQEIPAEWWTMFHSQEIDALVREALAHSPTLAAAQATLRQAQETLRANEGALLAPSATAQLQGTRERVSSKSHLTVVNANVDVSYNVDVFGGARRQIEGFQAQADFSSEELEATYLTLTANVVTAALREASYRAQLKTTREIADEQARQVEVVQRQYAVGAVPRSTVLQQRTQLAATNASIPGLEKQLAQTRDQLAVLVGKTPSSADLPVVTLEALSLPTDLPVSLPSNLVRQRPDIRASEAQLHQASAQIGVATAAMLPQFSLTGEYGYSGSSLGHLVNPADAIWSLAAGVTQPLFKGGQLAAERRAAIAAYDAAWQQYQRTVLLAFQNVADTLVALDADAKTLAADAEADDLARETLTLVQAQYKLGAASFLSLLIAQQQYSQAHITLVQAQTSRFIDTATLFQALGGGWWNRAQPLADISHPTEEAGREANK